MGKQKSIKLTKAQRKVIELLQRGECIVNDDKYFYVSDKYTQHRIDWRVWAFLTKSASLPREWQDALIRQEGYPHFHWELTQKGRDLKL